ncbi:hypothetical protein K2V61_12435 [Staphylococcus simulans]|uniref:hypothetical protein n=1 Tax=Staphylococcus simulans TaxID=1286 RepID=UPI001E4F2B97|nr:hypothetical protein [Staphylococcus simulans]MCD8916347.1 hypothetical protein [Staphylococcus simulans]
MDQEDVEVGFVNWEILLGENERTTTIKPEITGKYTLAFNHSKRCFEIVVEEEITEETVIPLLLEKCEDVHGNVIGTFYNSESIEDVLNQNSLVFYMVDIDKVEITTLWTKEGGMQ